MRTLTAGEILSRITSNLGVPWRDDTYRDTYKFGGPETEVTGIATTAFCSFDVLRRAADAGLNMIVPHEVTYWNDRDDTTIVDGDLVYEAKVDFMQKHGMVVFRMHDHMHVQRPDFTYRGSARALGLDDKYETAPGSHRFVVPETTLGELAARVQKRLGANAIRVVGDPNARIRRIQLGVGYATPPLNTPDVDVVVSGESCSATLFQKSRACSKWPPG
jgi:putative NIF3 family GTP cyclohydrolase 1 type 2